MANPSISLVMVFLCLSAVLAMGCPPSPSPCECRPQKNETLRYYLHQFPDRKDVPKPNEVLSVNGSGPPFWFGQMYTHDQFLTSGPNPTDQIVARVQGFHLQSSQTSSSFYTSQIIVFQNGSRFAGSTLQVLGLTTDPNGGEWSIMGGTRTFARAQGTITWTRGQSSTSIDGVKDLDIHVFYAPETPTVIQGAAIL